MEIQVNFISKGLVEAYVDEISTEAMSKEEAALFADMLLATAEEITEKLNYDTVSSAIALAREIFTD